MDSFYCVITFNATHHALLFENLMISNGIEVKLIPVPRQISSSCGTAAQFSCDLELEIKRLCNIYEIPIDDFHQVVKKQEKSWFARYINKPYRK